MNLIKKSKISGKKIIVCCSGGPDSIYLLNKLKDVKPIVFHVNYNKRKTADRDQKIVEKFCFQNNLILEKFFLNKKDKFEKNFQDFARKKRIFFLQKIAKKYNTNLVFLAHHKDDFLESAIYFKKTKRQKFFYGIKKINFINGLVFYRPLVNKVWKKQILVFLQKHKIDYGVDETNFLPIYERNKIRLEIKKISHFKKIFLYLFFVLKNCLLFIFFLYYKKIFLKWKNKSYATNFFSKKKLNTKKKILIFFFNHFNLEISSQKKIVNIIRFIDSKKNSDKVFKIKDNLFFKKKSGKLILFYD